VIEYVAAVASASPTPGGGSVAATVAALAASLAEMVCSLTLSGKKTPNDPAALSRASGNASRLRKELLDLASSDEEAYAGYRAASALPKSTEEEQKIRRDALDAALITAADIPLKIAETAVEVLSQLGIAAVHGSKHALSDVATGALLAEAAVRSSLLNVEVNANLMRDEQLAASYRSKSESVRSDAGELAADVLETVTAR